MVFIKAINHCNNHKLNPLKMPEMKRIEHANSVEPDKAAHDELPLPVFYCLPSSL